MSGSRVRWGWRWRATGNRMKTSKRWKDKRNEVVVAVPAEEWVDEEKRMRVGGHGRKWHYFAITPHSNNNNDVFYKNPTTTDNNQQQYACTAHKLCTANGTFNTLVVAYLGIVTATAITVNNSEKIASASSTFVRNWENEIIDFQLSMGAFLAGWHWQHKWAL